MKRTNFLMTTIMSTLLLSSTISAHSVTCKGGKCFIDISKLSQPHNVDSKINTFKHIENLHFSTEQKNPSEDTIVLDHSKYIMNDDEKKNYLLDDRALYNAEDTIVFSHSKYVMTDKEKEEYFLNKRLQEAELEAEIILPNITMENELTEGIILPHSELYCDNEQQAKFYPESNEYECT